MNLKEKLLSLKDSVHSVKIGDDTIYFKHLKASHNPVLAKYKDEDTNTVAFILACCDESGSELFTMDDLDDVKQFPRKIVNVVSNASMLGNEKSPLGTAL
ncbi:hypothetical protein JCM19241_5974 [Vibrio ishigakensis]|uniref:Phage protein n=1 Tax=Vibrio ishigakensis TaxID=1481914 RepID=A0A0B8QQ31_9VIBR|nr:hypothetical protein JCM19241_5974 [Vibrio ishigakensis]